MSKNEKSNGSKVILAIVVLVIFCLVIALVVATTSQSDTDVKQTYVESSILDNVIRITGIYENPDLNKLFFSKDETEKDAFEYSLLRERVLFSNDYYDVLEENQNEDYKIFKYRISETELDEIAADYNIKDYKKYFNDEDILCEHDENSNVISTDPCGEGSIKYYLFTKSSFIPATGLFPHYSHKFKLYEDGEDVILEDEMKVTYEPTNETKTKKIIYTFSKNNDKYYLKEVK